MPRIVGDPFDVSKADLSNGCTGYLEGFYTVAPVWAPTSLIQKGCQAARGDWPLEAIGSDWPGERELLSRETMDLGSK